MSDDNIYKLRWDLKSKGFYNGKAGATVDIIDMEPGSTVRLNGGQNWAGTAMITADKQKIPAAFIIYNGYGEEKVSGARKAILDAMSGNADLVTGKWFMGRVPPPDAGRYLAYKANDQGTFVVCQPPEWIPENNAGWAPYCLAVRTYSGDVDEFVQEWREDSYYNLRFAEKFGGPKKENEKNAPKPHERLILEDYFPDQPSPMSHVCYFIIHRGETGTSESGKYFIDRSHIFDQIEFLLDYYYKHPLPRYCIPSMKTQLTLTLRIAGDVNDNPSRSPRPSIRLGKPMYDRHFNEKHILSTEEDIKRFHPIVLRKLPKRGLERKGEDDDDDNVDRRIPMLFKINGRYRPVAVRRLRQELLKSYGLGLDRDLTLLHGLSGSKFSRVHPLARLHAPIKFRQGSQFLAKIIACSVSPTGPWVAYDICPGEPLDLVLLSYRYNNVFLTPRCRYEVLYQVAAGMRYLEVHDLCHRNLRANNIEVISRGQHHLGVKIVDYMIPQFYQDVSVADQSTIQQVPWAWMAPETILQDGPISDIVSDVWAFGCVMFEVINYGQSPWSFEDPPLTNVMSLGNYILKGSKMKIFDNDDDTDTFLEDLVGKCLTNEPTRRPTFERLYHWLKTFLFDGTTCPANTGKELINDCCKDFKRRHNRILKQKK